MMSGNFTIQCGMRAGSLKLHWNVMLSMRCSGVLTLPGSIVNSVPVS